MRVIALLVVLLIASNVAAIKMLQDNRPSDVPADAAVRVGEAVDVDPKTPPIKTDVVIERIVPEAVSAGDTFDVTLKVTNNYKDALKILLVDPQRAGIEYIGGPSTYTVEYESYVFQIFRWEETIPSGQTKSYAYKIRAGSPGTITYPPASVNDDFGNVFESRPAFTEVKCKPDGVCGPGENYVFCPGDCKTGARDDSCDGVEDGRVDPDCVMGADPDEAKPSTTTLPDWVPATRTQQSQGWCNMLALPLYALLTAVAARRIF
jgi:hypothetical protein